MLCCETLSSSSLLPPTRKRTSSFSCSPRPAKSPRLSTMASSGTPLKRTQSFLNVADAVRAPKERRRPARLPVEPVAQQRRPPPSPIVPYRTSSPLSPVRTVHPARPVFPRSKTEPSLYRKALTTCMSNTPSGQKILHMGPRLALSIMNATQELERIVSGSNQDVSMSDAPNFCSSWVNVPAPNDDWEMVDCSA